MQPYNEAFPVLRDVLLEDSWVLAVWPSDTSLAFDLEAVLTPAHRDYVGPKPGEQHDYRRAHLVITSDGLRCDLSGAPPATDATGQTDLGHIDNWLVEEAGRSLLEGGWGAATADNPSVELRFIE